MGLSSTSLNVQKKSYLYFYPSYLDFKARTVSGCLSIRKMAATDRCANCGFKMTAFGRPPLWIVVFYSLGGFKLQLSSLSCFGLLTGVRQLCDRFCQRRWPRRRSGGGQDGKDRRKESLFYMLQPLHYAVEETALFPLLDDTDAKAVPDDGSLSHLWLRRFLHVSITF